MENAVRYKESDHRTRTTWRHIQCEPVLALPEMHVRRQNDDGEGHQTQDIRYASLQLTRRPVAMAVSIQVACLLEGRLDRSAGFDIRLHFLLRDGERDPDVWRR